MALYSVSFVTPQAQYDWEDMLTKVGSSPTKVI